MSECLHQFRSLCVLCISAVKMFLYLPLPLPVIVERRGVFDVEITVVDRMPDGVDAIDGVRQGFVQSRTDHVRDRLPVEPSDERPELALRLGEIFRPQAAQRPLAIGEAVVDRTRKKRVEDQELGYRDGRVGYDPLGFVERFVP